MDFITNLWHMIVKSNTFNFVVMLIVLRYIVVKIDLKSSISTMQQKIIQGVENSKTEQKNAQTLLGKSKKEFQNLDLEVKSRLEQAKSHAEIIAKQIIDDTNSKISLIESSVEKTIESEEKTISTKLSEQVAKTAIDLAKSNIEKALKERIELHEKLIDESIQELDGVVI
ncbi:MAG: ATP synthase F0 subunit B [Candidatus Gastranaerophilales bacterium]